ncbi:MAG: aminotransferase class III-fold pyridoxal phosphate-dependent enzyme [Bacteroidota bacterium]
MKSTISLLNNLEISLLDLLGEEYMQAVCVARAFIANESVEDHLSEASRKVEFFPEDFSNRLDELLELTGKKVTDGLVATVEGATTNAFREATTTKKSPLSAYGFIRIGEDGRIYLASKSEHYHAPLGHDFPGYRLVAHAQNLGIPNATHNNTRGTITRLLEEEMVRVANGIEKDDKPKLQEVLRSEEPHVLNRVINLETGSLAVEAALKMMLTRFYRLDKTYQAPKYEGRTPVFLVMADHQEGKEANYHGTTVLTQFMRGMWPEFYGALEQNNIFRVESVELNSVNDFNKKIEEFDSGKYKIAGFFHEIVLMNYGGIRLTKEYLTNAYELCHEYDIPVLVDEIQSCLWSPEFFMFREYGLKPDFVAVGKGFPGGQYPASRILATAEMDQLNLFGALVTNGQEELASLTYLITMAFAEANKDYTREMGDYYENEIRKLGRDYNTIIDNVEGIRHMTTVVFSSADDALAFTRDLDKRGIDISVQTYKANCAPAALLKIPLISSPKMINFIISNMRTALKRIASEKQTAVYEK